MAGGMLQHKPHHSQWSEVLHPAHAGAAPHPHHGPGHPELGHYEHPTRLPEQGLHNQAAGQCTHDIVIFRFS